MAVATNLATARAAFERTFPSIVLLDIRLGPEDGTEFVAWLRTLTAYNDTPVIAVTAHALRDEQERILKAGCNSVVSKPVELHALALEMRRWLDVAEKSTLAP